MPLNSIVVVLVSFRTVHGQCAPFERLSPKPANFTGPRVNSELLKTVSVRCSKHEFDRRTLLCRAIESRRYAHEQLLRNRGGAPCDTVLALSCPANHAPTAHHAQDRTEGAVDVRESTATARRPSVKNASPVRLWRGAVAAAASTPATKPIRATRSATSRSFST